MKRANEIEPAASKLNAHLTPVSTQAVQTRREKPPHIREEHRGSVLQCLPDELFREIGKHLPLRQWIALRQLCKAFTEQVDRQPPFILLDPDVKTDKLFYQFLKDTTPEYAYKLANLVSKLSLSPALWRDAFGEILEEIAKAKSWERIKIRSHEPLFVVARPLLDTLSHAPCGAKRKLAYYGKTLDKDDREFVEKVQRSASLQLTTLETEDVADFLPFIAGNAEFSDIKLNLKNSATLTRETFKALQQMQGSVKRLSLESMGSIDASEILDALLDKGLESLIIWSSHPSHGVDLLPWLTLPLKSLKLKWSSHNPATLADALGITETLKTLEISYELGLRENPDDWPFQEKIKSLVLALRMNHTIEHFSLHVHSNGNDFVPILAELLHAILNHTTIKYLKWNSFGNSFGREWPKLAAPIKPKAMNGLFFKNCSVGMVEIVNVLEQLSSLKCLHLIFSTGLTKWNSKLLPLNSEFLPLLSRLGVEELSLDVDEAGGSSVFANPLSIAECLIPGLKRLDLDVGYLYDSTGMGAALAGTATLRSLKILRFSCVEMSAELVKGLVGNESLVRIELGLDTEEDPDDYDNPIDTAIGLAKIIEAILDHSSISYAYINCDVGGGGSPVFLPEEYRELLEHLEPGLDLVLSDTTECPPENVPPEKIQAVSNIYKRIVERYATDDSSTTETSSPIR